MSVRKRWAEKKRRDEYDESNRKLHREREVERELERMRAEQAEDPPKPEQQFDEDLFTV